MTEIALFILGACAGMIAVMTYAKNKVATAELERDRAQRKVVEVERDCARKVNLAEAVADLSPQERAIRELIARGAISDYTGYYILARHAHGDIDFQVPEDEPTNVIKDKLVQNIPW